MISFLHEHDKIIHQMAPPKAMPTVVEFALVGGLVCHVFVMHVKGKGMVLYSAVSSPLDRSKRFTLHFVFGSC